MKANMLAAALLFVAGATGCKNMMGHTASTIPTTVSPSQAFEMEGTITHVKGDKVTIARQGLPTAILQVEPTTQVMLNGTNVSTKALPAGGTARARFQLDDEKPIAITLEVSSPQQSGSSAPAESMPPPSGSEPGSGSPPPDESVNPR